MESEYKINKLSLLKPKYLIIISIILIFLIILSALYEYRQNKKEVYHLLNENANSLIHTISKSSENSIISDNEMENLLAQHLLGVARNVFRLDEKNMLSAEMLQKIALENEVFRINIFNEKGQRIFSNYNSDSMHLKEKGKYSPSDFLSPILNGSQDEIIIGLKEARVEKGMRFAVAVRRFSGKGAIVVNLDANSFVDFKNKIGFGKLILDMGQGSGIEFIALQNEKEFIAANRNVDELSKLSDDTFIKNVFEKDTTLSREIVFQNKKVLEVCKLFKIENEKIGVFRIGLSLDEINYIDSRMFLRAILVSLIVIVITIIVLSVVISNQNFRFINDEFKKVKTFTGNILENLSLGLITVDNEFRIKIFNKSAFEIFEIPYSDFENKNMNEFKFSSENVLKILTNKTKVKNLEVEENLGLHKKYLMLNSNEILNQNNELETYTLVIEDITDYKIIERRLQQNNRMIAMGELASGVAHEIRNPLNTINMIAQRFEREYSPKIKSEDFDTLNGILYSESHRVNDIIEQFLKFTKPAKLVLIDFKIKEFLEEIKNIAEVQTNSKNINFEIICNDDRTIKFDYQQMKQVLINLIRNAVEATQEFGTIKIMYHFSNNKNIFEISDSGCGISPENIDKIFDIYFTTKQTGTGMGLSIVRQIIMQHNGTISAESSLENGTKFTITLPEL